MLLIFFIYESLFEINLLNKHLANCHSCYIPGHHKNSEW